MRNNYLYLQTLMLMLVQAACADDFYADLHIEHARAARNIDAPQEMNGVLLPISLGMIALILFGLRQFNFQLDEPNAQTEAPDQNLVEFNNSRKTTRADILEVLDIDISCLPSEFICPLTLDVINGIPVFCLNEPNQSRFDHEFLLAWMKLYTTNPITRRTLSPQMLVQDYILDARIDLCLEFIVQKINVLKSLSDAEIRNHVNIFNSSLDAAFGNVQNDPIQVLALKNKLIDRLNASHLHVHSLFANSLTIAKQNHSVRLIVDFASRFDCYQLLGISHHASKQEIESAFRKEAGKWHSDKNNNPGAAEHFHVITTAKNILLNDQARDIYDKQVKLLTYPKEVANHRVHF